MLGAQAHLHVYEHGGAAQVGAALLGKWGVPGGQTAACCCPPLAAGRSPQGL